jgi:hypothetical protein
MNRDDEDAADDAGERVADRQPDAAENQPEDAYQRLHLR